MAETDTLVVTVSSLPVVQDRTEVQTVRGGHAHSGERRDIGFGGAARGSAAPARRADQVAVAAGRRGHADRARLDRQGRVLRAHGRPRR